ncbi:methyl-accepting chemotaxis protein [Xylophilus sp. Leaf220]|uniref:methyl-accepting chemotaxis protein n=1 Tax=Xylophilus sp. Leaf220 TaxID=1735686 RepID=UPI0006FE4FB1|nr:methyl-accepting chemotaxis protein [Xylophilus sp. Leaf220]KQM68660.1 chemotaxis protein [Xylophilus sp. Leaf220]
MNLRHLRIATKLWIAVGVIVLALVAAAVSTGVRLVRAQAEADAALAATAERVDAAESWMRLTEANAVRTQALVLSAEPQMEAAFKGPIAATSARISEIQKRIASLDTTPATVAQLEKIAASRKTMADVRAQAVGLKAAGQQSEAVALVGSRYDPAVAAYLKDLGDFVSLQQRVQAETAARIGADRSRMLQIAGIALAAIVLAILAGAFWLIRSILRPLAEANALAARIAGGDLSGAVEVQRQDEFGTLLRSLQAMNAALSRMVLQVRQSTDSIAVASAEIATGNQDLSQRTEQTSGSLQQAASSMEQLTATVQQTAGSARQASQLASAASAVAQKGGGVVQDVVATMDEINTSSRRIGDIIGTIDGIAFQTNILALNAAVEAARAGEQGRGFAVVAGEVRSLAQRSAQAAREIKTLIGASMEKVETGARLVQDAGTTMADIVQSVQRVADIIGEITAAASEQSAGIAQVNGTVGTLDQMTQQNAALVEQSAAAAQSLREQADQLTGLVAVFRLHPDEVPGARPAGAAAQPARRTAAPARPAVAAPPKTPSGSAATPALRTQPATPRLAVVPPPKPRPTTSAAPASSAPPRAAAPAPRVAAGAEDDWESF